MMEFGAQPRVTVGMPVYNGARYLAETLDCWLAQDYDDFELLVCDNASTDATAEILAKYASENPRIRVVRRDETVPVCDNFNGVARDGSSEFFAWAACDDPRDSTFLRKLVAEPEAVLAYSQICYVGDGRRDHRHLPVERPVAVEALRKSEHRGRIGALDQPERRKPLVLKQVGDACARLVECRGGPKRAGVEQPCEFA
jgi:cellulose synthase/poly-beta-1,6-N-acetylglucosamine synthase-like glycosyltransferase